MSADLKTPINNRYEISLLVECIDGNPNGDPDMGNQPRYDGESGQGIITDVCIKRKLRNAVAVIKAEDDGFANYITEGAVLDRFNASAIERAKAAVGDKGFEEQARRLMCEQFFDIRAFGGVLVGDHIIGRVTGPVQVQFGRSIDRIAIQEHAITRMAATKESDAAKGQTMGRKYTIPYGLYRINLFLSPFKAQGVKGTGFSEADLQVLIDALQAMYELDHASARANMAVRAMVVFKHDSALGNAPAHKVLETLTAVKKVDAPRAYADYTVTLDEDALPKGVSATKVVW
jgi:CRISPR-associated protein Csd2